MPSWRDNFPEADCLDAGDPFLREVVKADDDITDLRYNYWLWDLDEETGHRLADQVEREQLSYELGVLYRWWAQPAS